MTNRATKEEIEQAEQKFKATIAEEISEPIRSDSQDDKLDLIEESKYTEL